MTDARVMVAANLLAAAVFGAGLATACTGFCAAIQGKVLVGNNEDWVNPRTRIWFEPASKGSYGRVLVGYENYFAQGGMNEKGLFIDGFAAPPIERAPAPEKEKSPGSLIERGLSECATVEEAIRLFSRLAMPDGGVFLIADASGDAVAIEPAALVRKKDWFFVQTNFYQSMTPAGEEKCKRYLTARRMLEESRGEVSLELFRRILSATRLEGKAVTQYSNIYDLKARVMYLYHQRNFEKPVRLDLLEELKKGRQRMEIAALF